MHVKIKLNHSGCLIFNVFRCYTGDAFICTFNFARLSACIPDVAPHDAHY